MIVNDDVIITIAIVIVEQLIANFNIKYLHGNVMSSYHLIIDNYINVKFKTIKLYIKHN